MGQAVHFLNGVDVDDMFIADGGGSLGFAAEAFAGRARGR
jgi:hypothetical protein